MSRKREKRGSLNYQINQRMKEMDRIGESRYEAKQDYRENIGENKQGKTVGIHSYGTFETYKSSIKQFTDWAKENDRGIRNIEDVKEQDVKDYIKYRADEGYSSYTYSKDLSALNKVFGTDVLKNDCNVTNRSYTEISNNREFKEHHNHINYNNYRDEITVLRGTGMRRESLEKVSFSSFNYDSNGYPTSIRLQDERSIGAQNLSEKGGRGRVAEIPSNMREELREVLDAKLEEYDGDTIRPLFDHVPTRLGTHRFRQEYAQNIYKSYIEENGYNTKTLEDIDKDKYEDNKNTTFRGYDVGALDKATKCLGHNRLDVVIYNYLKVR